MLRSGGPIGMQPRLQGSLFFGARLAQDGAKEIAQEMTGLLSSENWIAELPPPVRGEILSAMTTRSLGVSIIPCAAWYN